MSNRRDTAAELRAVTYRAAGCEIIVKATLAVGCEPCVGILGPNGAGKSTVLGLLNGSLRPSGGSALLFGKDPWRMREEERAQARRRIATVFQRSAHSTLPPLGAREVVAIGRLGSRGLASRLSEQDWRTVDDAMARLGV